MTVIVPVTNEWLNLTEAAELVDFKVYTIQPVRGGPIDLVESVSAPSHSSGHKVLSGEPWGVQHSDLTNVWVKADASNSVDLAVSEVG